MAPEEEPKSDAPSPDSPGSRTGPRRSRRPGRGRRGRGRGGRPKQANIDQAQQSSSDVVPDVSEPEAIFELAEEPGSQPEESIRSEEIPNAATISPVSSAPSEITQSRAASPASVEQAIQEVNSVVDALRTALEDMEEVLEMLELFERQKNADEREIDSLRRALRQVHRPRDSGHHPHR